MRSRDPELTRPEVSNRIGQGLLAYFDQRFGAEWTDTRVTEAGLHRSDLADPDGWTGGAFAARLALAVAKALHPEDAPWGYDHEVWKIYHEAGQASVSAEYLGPVFHVARAFGSPMVFFKQLPSQVMRLQRALTVEMLEIGGRSIRMRVTADEPRNFPAAACWNFRGSLEAVPRIWGLPDARVELVACRHQHPDAHTACEYRVSTQRRKGLDQAGLLAGAAGGALVGAGAAAAVGVAGPALALAGVAGGAAATSALLARRLQRTRGDLLLEAGFLDEQLTAAAERSTALWDEQMKLRRALLASRKLSDYLPSDLVDRIVRDPEPDLRLGGKTTNAAVLFADLVGFTRRCERMRPERVVDELNLYFQHIDPAFVRHGGVIDKRMGDGVMAVFVPRAGVGADQVRRRAVRCGLDLLRALDACNKALAERGSAPLSARVGVAAGSLVQGTMGSAARLEYTVIGDVVNLAARLEGKATPGHVLVTSDVWSAFPATPSGCLVAGRSIIMVKGKAEAIDVVELAPDGDAAP